MFELAEEIMKAQRTKDWAKYRNLSIIYNSMAGFAVYDISFNGGFEDSRVMPLKMKIDGRVILQYNS